MVVDDSCLAVRHYKPNLLFLGLNKVNWNL
jgi:hypothetical protein